MAKRKIRRFKVPKNLPPLTLGELADKYQMKKKDLRDVARGLRDCGAISEEAYKGLLKEIKTLK